MYAVPSRSEPGRVHLVTQIGERWACSCRSRFRCWHIEAAVELDPPPLAGDAAVVHALDDEIAVEERLLAHELERAEEHPDALEQSQSRMVANLTERWLDALRRIRSAGR